MSRHTVIVSVPVEVELSDELLNRIVEREKIDPTYSELQTPEGVLEHLARNRVCLGVRRANTLDGFADLKDNDILFREDEAETEIEGRAS